MVKADATSATRKESAYGAPTTGTAGPTVTLTTGTKAMEIVTGSLAPSAGGSAFLSYSVSGASTIAASDEHAVIREHGSSSDTGLVQASTTSVVTGLTAGSNTFTLQYRSSSKSDTATFSNRSITVIPLG